MSRSVMAYAEQHKWINVQQKTFTKWFVDIQPWLEGMRSERFLGCMVS